MKKRVISVIFAVVILSLVLVSCGNKSDAPKGMKLASDESNGFYTMYVPENWVIIETGSNVTFAQAQKKELRTDKLAPATVNAMFWQKDQNYETNEQAYEAFFQEYNSQMKKTFGEENFFPQGEPSPSAHYEGAMEYTYVAKYDNIYYKYIATIILHKQNYYAVTFNFPQSNLTIKDNKIEAGKYEDAKFEYAEEYKDAVSDVVSNFKPLK